MQLPRKNRVTLSDVGEKCGVHRTTVGLALRNSPSIPPETKARILKAAAELGYRPDPALASLVAYRHHKSDVNSYSTIALISDSDYGARFWRSENHQTYWRGLYQGVLEQATALGYQLQEFTVGTDRRHTRRISSILHARGISAVIVTRISNLVDPIELDWNRISAVSATYSLRAPAIPLVTTQHRANAYLAVNKLIEMGYRRIGLATVEESDKRVDNAWTAGFLSACFSARQLLSHHSIRMTTEKIDNGDLACQATLDWIHENRIESFLCTQQHVLPFLVRAGLKVPQDIGFAALDLPAEQGDVSGINQTPDAIGREAVNMISAMRAKNQTGIPRFREIHLIRGVWRNGKTIRQPIAAE